LRPAGYFARKKKPHEGGGTWRRRQGREEGEGGEGEEEEISTIPLNNALGTDAERQSTKNELLLAKAVRLPLIW
jgi:hypothetical protein